MNDTHYIAHRRAFPDWYFESLPVKIQEPIQFVPRAQMLVDADQILSDFNADYTEMAK